MAEADELEIQTVHSTESFMEIAPGVHRVPHIRGANVYLLAADSGLTLIDTGLPGNAGNVLRFVESLGRRPEELRHILLTHGHPDHTGSARALREVTGAAVLVHEADTRIVSVGPRRVQCPGLPHLVTPPAWRVPVDGLLEEGASVDGLRVLHTPGHTPGGVGLFLEDVGVLFTGDLLTQRGRYVSRSVPFPGTRLAQYHASLARVSELPVRTACLGHGAMLTERVQETLRQCADWYAGSPAWRRWLQRVPGPLRPGVHAGFRYR